jgi:hypothetical protein
MPWSVKMRLMGERVFKSLTAREGGFVVQSWVTGNEPEAGCHSNQKNQENYKFAISSHSKVLSNT